MSDRILELENQLKEMEEKLAAKDNELEQKNKQLSDMKKEMDAVFYSIGYVVESRDENTGHHVFRTSQCVEVFVNILLSQGYNGLDQKLAEDIIMSAPLHDIGKVAVDDAILRKKGRFTDDEYDKIKKHSAEGGKLVYMVLSDFPDVELIRTAVNIARYHHERWDGRGYPTGISGEKIPLEARIMSFADVLDALLSKRCYKDSYSYDKAFSIIEESLGTQFDPELGKVFLASRESFEKLYDELLSED